jgi:hypothetical protein
VWCTLCVRVFVCARPSHLFKTALQTLHFFLFIPYLFAKGISTTTLLLLFSCHLNPHNCSQLT